MYHEEQAMLFYWRQSKNYGCNNSSFQKTPSIKTPVRTLAKLSLSFCRHTEKI